jgi:tRNA 5-methylaminomethyl-2-thiouridine biosynthesis bifunctional protein
VAVSSGGWWFAGGGWLAPREYASALLAESGAGFSGGARVARIRRVAGVWQALDERGGVLGEAPVLVLANALDAPRLLAGVPASGAAPLAATRGQISSLCLDAASGLPRPRVPVAGNGYVLPPVAKRLMFGASSQLGDEDVELRTADHRRNLVQLAELGGGDAEAWAERPWQGRVGWRAVTPDRLPLIGAVADLAALGVTARADQPRFVPRLRDAHGGLYLFTGLGSRGITWAALGAQLLASWISGAPCPVETDLRDALDPARHALGRWADRVARPAAPQ